MAEHLTEYPMHQQRRPIQLLPAMPLDTMETTRGILRAGVLRRDANDGNPCGVSFWPAGAHSVREVDLTRRLFAAELAAAPGDLRILRQEHGTRILLHAASEPRPPELAPDTPPVGDGQVSTTAGPVLVINIADCCPVIVVDVTVPVVGIAHAGWRGTAAGVVNALLGVMREQGARAERCTAWVGPCADGDGYQVGPEVAEHFRSWPDAVSPDPAADGRYLLDIAEVNCRQLEQAGLVSSSVTRSRLGTLRDSRFHSHRRDHFRAGRMAAFVSIRP